MAEGDYIAGFDNFPLIDDQPNVEGANVTVGYASFSNYNYVDREAYATNFVSEVDTMAHINYLVQRGEEFISLLYTYRSCSKALPQPSQTDDAANRSEIYQRTYEVLQPQIAKLVALMRFTNNCIDFLVDEFTKMASVGQPGKKKGGGTLEVSDSLVWSFVRLLDLLVVLDSIKNMKGCNNDLSFYKRAYAFLRKENFIPPESPDQEKTNQAMYFFLANQNVILTALKKRLHPSKDTPGVPGFDVVITLILDECLARWESSQLMLPSEKHSILRVIPFAVFLYDSDDPSKKALNAFKSDAIKLVSRFQFLKRYPVVPLYGDMHIHPQSIVDRCVHYDAREWPTEVDQDKLEQQYKLLNRLPSIRKQHDSYVAMFSARLTEIRNEIRNGKIVDRQKARDMYAFVLRGFRMLSNWTCAVLEQSAWKFAHPIATLPPGKTADEIVEYEKVMRYNYDSEERYGLVEIIAMIKGMSVVMIRADSLLMELLRRHIHDEMQYFIQHTLRDMIRHATKKKKLIRATLMQLRAMAADWADGVERKDPAMQGKDDEKGAPFMLRIPSRCAGPSPTQLQLMRCMVNAVYSKCQGKNARGQDLKPQHIEELKKFYERSNFYQYVTDYAGTIRQVTDLSMLWYREFYLELSKVIQFPIEMSLPWILTDHILESYEERPAMVEYILYPLDLYNDAANTALRYLRQQFMYDEVEAEVNLVFDQLVYKLSEKLFEHSKVTAAARLLDEKYMRQVEDLLDVKRTDIPPSRFEVMLRQRHFQLLGRSIDISDLLSERMNFCLRENLDYAITKFEMSSPLSGIMELDTSIEVIRATHAHLSQYLGLDPFEVMMGDADDSSSIVSFHGRIVLACINNITGDLMSNYLYNGFSERFIKQPICEEVQRDPPPKIPPVHQFGNKMLNLAYASLFEIQKDFIGNPHWRAMLNVVGRTRLGFIVDEIVKDMERRLTNTIVPYVSSLLDGMPENTKLPLHTYGTSGCYLFYEATLEPILNYPDLKSSVFQAFHEFGNGLVLLRNLDNVAREQAAQRYPIMAPFFGATDTNPTIGGSFLATRMSELFSALGTEAKVPTLLSELPEQADRAMRLYGFIQSGHSLFRAALMHFFDYIKPLRNEWMGPPPINNVLDPDVSFEFYRLWSALLFIFAAPPKDNIISPEQFGDGFLWAGATFIYLMNQQERFRTFDFSHHIVTVENAAAVKSADQPIQYFITTARNAFGTTEGIFDALRAYMPYAPPVAVAFRPPDEDDTAFR